MVSSIIAYSISGAMAILAAACVGVAFDDRYKAAPFPLLLAFLFFGFLAWGFAKLGGI